MVNVIQKKEEKMGKFLRFIGILFMSLTAAFTLMGGAGTTCVALAAEKYDSMISIAPYKWLYVLFVLVTLAIGVIGVRSVIMLIKGRPTAYRDTLITLVAGIVVGGIHMAVSRALRGSSMPVDMVVYTTVLTLIIFLLFRLPGVWEKVNWQRINKSESNKTGGAAMISVGVACLIIQVLMAPTHTFGGINYGDAFHATLTLAGWVLIGSGVVRLAVAYGLTHVLSQMGAWLQVMLRSRLTSHRS